MNTAMRNYRKIKMSYSLEGDVKSLKTGVYFIRIEHLHLDLPHFNSSRSQGVTGHSNAQCSSGGQQKGIAERPGSWTNLRRMLSRWPSCA